MTALVRNLLSVLLGVGAIAAAGDPTLAAGQESATSRVTSPAQKKDDAPAAEPPPEPEPTPTPAPTPDAEKQLEEFVPTEKVPADQGVAFPVDI